MSRDVEQLPPMEDDVLVMRRVEVRRGYWTISADASADSDGKFVVLDVSNSGLGAISVKPREQSVTLDVPFDEIAPLREAIDAIYRRLEWLSGGSNRATGLGR